MRLTCVHSTRGRVDLPTFAYDQRMKTRSKQHEIEYIFVVDEDDPIGIDLVQRLVDRENRECARYLIAKPSPLWGPRMCEIHALNEGWAAATGEIIVQVADDTRAPEKWDARVVERIGDPSRPAVLGVGDPHFSGGTYSGNGLLGTLIATRARCVQQGYFYYPEYDGMCGDMDATQKSVLDDVLVDVYNDDVLWFRHYWVGGGDQPGADATTKRHADTVAHHIGYDVWAARVYAGMPNIEMLPGTDAAAEDVAAGRFGYPPYPAAEHIATLADQRRARGFAHIRNKSFPEGTPQYHMLRGEWKLCQEALMPIMRKYHHKACGRRFDFYLGRQIWTQCADQLGQGLAWHYGDDPEPKK